MRIPFVNAKGGVAKTTSAIYTALAASKDGRNVVLWDADPQASASLWAASACDMGDPLPFEVRPANIATLRSLRPDRDHWDIIDAAPNGAVAEAAVQAADFVVIPTSDSPIDLQQVWSMLRAMPEDKPCAVLVARAQISTNACRETLNQLDKGAAPRFDTVVPMRQDIKKALSTNPGNLHEYAAVYLELEEELEK